MNNKLTKRETRHARVRARITGTADRPRLSVFRSNRFIYAQLIDDRAGKTLASANDAKMKTKKGDKSTKVNLSLEVGKQIAELAKGLKITSVVFDRGGYRFTGRVKAVADGAREGGLNF